LHKHHIIFRSQGGLDFDLNLIELSYENHEGNNGPHLNRSVDLVLKRDLQNKLQKLFNEDVYSIAEISKLLGKSKRYFEKHFKRVHSVGGLYKREDIIFKLMGRQLY
jgi:hypothetical protein